MHPSAQSTWFGFISKHEGVVAHMYLDTKQLVTIGVGNLIDPLPSALALPFQFKASNKQGVVAGRIATRAEIESEWLRLKHHPMRVVLANLGHARCRSETDLELTPVHQQQLFWSKTQSVESALHQRFSAWSTWPADAQLCVMAMTWGLGAGSKGIGQFVKFSLACDRLDFRAAAAECQISTWRAERNAASLVLLRNAACVVADSTSYSAGSLYYPSALIDPAAVSHA